MMDAGPSSLTQELQPGCLHSQSHRSPADYSLSAFRDLSRTCPGCLWTSSFLKSLLSGWAKIPWRLYEDEKKSNCMLEIDILRNSSQFLGGALLEDFGVQMTPCWLRLCSGHPNCQDVSWGARGMRGLKQSRLEQSEIPKSSACHCQHLVVN